MHIDIALGMSCAAALAGAAPALGSVTAFVTESTPPGLAPDNRAWDINVTLADDVALPRYSVIGENVTSGHFLDPDPAQDLFQPGGTLADLWFTTASFAPNPIQPGPADPSVVLLEFSSTGFIGGAINFRIPPGDGTYIISRVITTDDFNGDIRVFLSSSANPDGEFVTFTVPSPGPAAALAFGSLAAFSRRRRA